MPLPGRGDITRLVVFQKDAQVGFSRLTRDQRVRVASALDRETMRDEFLYINQPACDEIQKRLNVAALGPSNMTRVGNRARAPRTLHQKWPGPYDIEI